MANLSRNSRNVDITLYTATSLATTLNVGDVAGGIVSFGTMSTNASTLQMWVASDSTGTFNRLYKSDGTVADITLAPSTSAGRAYSLPDEVFATQYLKVVSGSTNATGVAGVAIFKS